MKIPAIKDVMREQAKFVKYEDGRLWYQIIWNEGGSYSGGNVHLFDFPIPVDDAGGGAFTSSERALTLMRWIRKHIEFLNEVTSGQAQED